MKQIGLRVPEDLADQIAEAKGDVPLNTWIIRAIEAALATHAAESAAVTARNPLRLPPPGNHARLPSPEGFGQGALGKGYAPRPKRKP